MKIPRHHPWFYFILPANGCYLADAKRGERKHAVSEGPLKLTLLGTEGLEECNPRSDHGIKLSNNGDSTYINGFIYMHITFICLFKFISNSIKCQFSIY